jgi:hypothetical protein
VTPLETVAASAWDEVAAIEQEALLLLALRSIPGCDQQARDCCQAYLRAYDRAVLAEHLAG